MTRAWWMCVVASVFAGCTAVVPEPQYTFYPRQLELSPVAWVDDASLFRWESVSVLNETFFTLELRDVEIVGEGAAFLELRSISSITELPIRDSRSMDVRFAPPESGDRTRWTTGDYEAELKFMVGGSGVIDPTTQVTDPTKYVRSFESVPITFSINCDLDGDGFDAIACNGRDCDDEYATINPAAVEECDGIDNNCASGTDEGCL